MPATYSFVSRWFLPVSTDRVWEELERMLHPGADLRWWPGLTLPMAPRRLVAGERMVLAVRTPLGYRLIMRLQLTEVQPGHLLAAASEGDLRGSGRIEVGEGRPAAVRVRREARNVAPAAPQGDGGTVITVHWNVETRRAWMNATAWALRPVFERAHASVMRKGERGLRALLQR